LSENLLCVLELLLLALVYLFFLRVLRAVWTELRAPQLAAAPASAAAHGTAPPAASKKRRHRGAPPTAVVVLGTGQRFGVQEVVTLGRAAGCQIVVDDTYVSQVHARIFTKEGDVYVEDLGSTNGTYLNRQKLTAPRQLQRGDQIQLGTTVLEVQ